MSPVAGLCRFDALKAAETFFNCDDFAAAPCHCAHRTGNPLPSVAATLPAAPPAGIPAGRPETDLRITDLRITASTGERRVFTKGGVFMKSRVFTKDSLFTKDSAASSGSGVSLIDAVAASRAVPTVWPPVTIGAHRWS